MNPNIATPDRVTVRIPTASGDQLEAWVYRPEGTGPHPAVVMAHGFAAVKAGGLTAFADRFRHEGFTAVVFDYRQWGGSSGQPRDEVSVPRQRQDYRTVIDWTVTDPDIDALRRRSSALEDSHGRRIRPPIGPLEHFASDPLVHRQGVCRRFGLTTFGETQPQIRPDLVARSGPTQ